MMVLRDELRRSTATDAILAIHKHLRDEVVRHLARNYEHHAQYVEASDYYGQAYRPSTTWRESPELIPGAARTLEATRRAVAESQWPEVGCSDEERRVAECTELLTGHNRALAARAEEAALLTWSDQISNDEVRALAMAICCIGHAAAAYASAEWGKAEYYTYQALTTTRGVVVDARRPWGGWGPR